MNITIRQVARDDWQWIRNWFTDPLLDESLGPMDTQWLDYVLTDDSGVELVATDNEHPLMLAGVHWARDDDAPHVLTSIATDPARRREGLGSKLLPFFLDWVGHPAAEGWVAWVDEQNGPAEKFLLANSWSPTGKIEDGMKEFTLNPYEQTADQERSG